jgi:SAM-dependent methyltransferase
LTTKSHWDGIYRSKAGNRVSWHRPHLETSLRLVEQAAPDLGSAIIDVGGGVSTFVDDLITRGYRDVSVLDISKSAIDLAKARLGDAARSVRWIVGDITEVELAPDRYDVWHDRAVFHFLTSPEQRRAYVRQVTRAMKAGGHVIVATFGPEGPTTCSGLDVIRYDCAALHDELGPRFKLLDDTTELHETPRGSTQQFLYCLCRLG